MTPGTILIINATAGGVWQSSVGTKVRFLGRGDGTCYRVRIEDKSHPRNGQEAELPARWLGKEAE